MPTSTPSSLVASSESFPSSPTPSSQTKSARQEFFTSESPSLSTPFMSSVAESIEDSPSRFFCSSSLRVRWLS